MTNSKNLTDEKYWDTRWSDTSCINYTASLRWIEDSPLYSEIHKIFTEHLPKRRLRFLEVGCGGGKWIVYFSKIFGYDVFGIDISSRGLVKTKNVLDSARLQADLVRGSIITPPFKIEAFDIVFSDGLLEHFSNPREILVTLAELCKPSGFVITLVPNLTGIQKILIRSFNKNYIFNTHRIINMHELLELYRDLNFTDVAFYTLGSIAPKTFSNRITRCMNFITKLLYRVGIKIEGKKLSNTYLVIGVKR